jgi:hypothetical protein
MVGTDTVAERITATAPVRDGAVPCPYIGLKPYSEKERFLFFGRESDAKRLINKIFSARLTLFYGPSGVGKSSLLLARVAPDLRDARIGNSVVVIFDHWQEQAPEVAIKRQIAEAVGWNPTAEDQRQTFAILADRVNQAAHKTLILVLDQFEQFLLARSERPDPLRAELAELLRANVDVHVVLSLREEFLAGLEVFAREIVAIYDSKFRLEHLSDDGARDAIVKPAEKFAVSVEPALIDRLLVDLKRHAEAGTATAAMATGIELPFLQLVCKGLWEARKPNTNNLSLEQYEGLGGCDGIIRSYVENLANTLPRAQQQDAADVLRWLAPRSGIKQGYEAGQLAELTGMPVERVMQILTHFERNWVLRDRLVGGIHWFELYHDAYIKILAPWIDERLEEKRRSALLKRWLKLGALTAVGLAVAGLFMVSYVNDVREARLLEEGNIDKAIETVGGLQGYDARKEATELAITDYHFVRSAEQIWRQIADKTDEKNREEVAKRLKELEARFTKQVVIGEMSVRRERYIRKESCTEPWATDVVPEAKKPVLKLSIPTSLGIDDDALRCAWLQLTSSRRGPVFYFPLPRRIGIVHPAKGNSMMVTLGDEEAWEVPLGQLAVPGAGIVLDGDLDKKKYPQLAWFFANEKYDRTQVLGSEGKFESVDAWIVPRWTLPLLRAAKIAVRPAETGLAAAVEWSLWDHQKALLTPGLVKAMVERTRKDAPAIVAEAERARGDVERIRRVLLKIFDKISDELAKKNKGDNASQAVFLRFPAILDRLGEYPACRADEEQQTSSKDKAGRVISTDRPSSYCKDDDGAALSVVEDLRVRRVNPQIGNLPRSAPQKVGPLEQIDKRSKGDEFETLTEYDMPETAVPVDHQPLQVLYGATLARCLVEVQGLKGELQDEMSRLRRNLFKKYGVKLPNSSWLQEGDRADQLAVQFYGEPIGEISQPIALGSNCLKDVISAIEARVDRTSAMWVSAQDVENALVALGGSQEYWLRDTYSLTYLKLLLRAVLAPDSTTPSGNNDGRVVRDLPDLLASLIFWKQWCGPVGANENYTGCLVTGLRDTERTRFVAVPSPASDDEGAVSRKSLESAVMELIGAAPDAADKASRQFAKVVIEGAPVAKREFLRAFASQILRTHASRLEQRCSPRSGSVLVDPGLSDIEKVQIEDFFDAVATAKSSEGWQALRVCQIRSESYSKEADPKTDHLRTLLAQGSPTDWRADDAAAAAVLALEALQQGRELSDLDLNAAKSLIAKAFVEWSGVESKTKAEATFNEAIEICQKQNAPRGCWSLLKEALDVYGGPSTLLPLELAMGLVYKYPSQGEATLALELTSRAEKHLSEQSPDEEQHRLSAWIQLAKASAYLVLARNNDRAALDKASKLLSALADDANFKRANNTKSKRADWPKIEGSRIDAALLAGSLKDVQTILDNVQPRDDLEVEGYRMWRWVMQGDLQGARRSLQESKIDDDTRSYLFASLTFLENGPPSALKQAIKPLLANKHPYSDYLRLMLFASSAREDESAARQDLENRWSEIVKGKEIGKGTWKSRVERGEDNLVWQEMLVGYFLGHISRDDLVHWTASPKEPAAMTETPSEYRGEFYFYDAQLQWVTGDRGTRKERAIRSLHELRSSGPSLLNEYFMALYQLRVLEGTR